MKLFSTFFLLLCWHFLPAQDDLFIDLRQDGDLKGWKEFQPPETYSGEDLFLYINGGADIYLEYGFREVTSYHLQNEDGVTIHAEVYQMTDPGAAFGIYSLNKPDKSVLYNIGSEGYIHNYFMSYFKSDCNVILSANSLEKSAIEGLKLVARYLDRKIQGESSLPALVEKYEGFERSSGLKYFRGNIALSNIHFFSETNVFQVSEGISFNRNGMKVLIFKYDNIDSSRDAFLSGLEFFTNSRKYTIQSKLPDKIILDDNKTNRLDVCLHNDSIFIFIGLADSFNEKLVNEILIF